MVILTAKLKIMIVKINFKFLAVAVVGFILAAMTVTESIDKYISFAGEANAAGFFLMTSLLGILGLAGSFERINPKK